MSRIKLLGAFAALSLLAGCVTGYNIDAAKEVQPGNVSAFNAGLVKEYRDLTTFEADKMYDWPDADLFARKALAAANGETVLPEELANWDLPVDKIDEMAKYRAELVSLLDAGARTRVPDDAARAQGRFDCWVEQQEENHQPDDIAACKNDFLAALEKLKVTPAPMAPDRFTVYFDFDRSNIRPDAQAVLNDVVAAAKKEGVSEFSLTGHADRAGPPDYNLRLSIKRAESVRDYLVGKGFMPQNISVAGRGEADPAVPTADGVREQANRRVEIIFQ
ncbi:OmpA-OmpF porin, OOP family [Tistlia consotensis]|uniref:OmpA-OmpF porin, OOP family n=1 Tax=Tistlia consotensis USBA 355 TaxID=560819 RepID=A0A1Y6BJL8_9PROT|nr:OmpA family protein [Tistlia consotensis]SMF06991.1 OmpA-OmpF porin, OOP family [Tistlia consotensis USBA 355]SNR36151.1 OmpA-OmpF porin, OOP family [Tistlia consotensis]